MKALARLAILGAAGALTLVAMPSCSTGGGGSSPGAGVCDVVTFPYEEMMDDNADSFRSLIDVEPASGNQGVPAALLLLRGDADLGPYGPAVDFLADRYRAWDPSQGGGKEPSLTDEVRASAQRLDRDLAEGLCS